jgi:DNA-binding response OmpR family regulator
MAKLNIFIVEDDSDICRLVQHHLQTAGFATTAFSNGRTVIEEAERVRPCLFLLDVKVPGKDGFELCRTIRQVPWLAPLRLFS